MLEKNSNNGKSNFSIINISSVNESIPQSESVSYALSKGGMMILTRYVTFEMADKDIHVNAIAPGAIATDMNKDIMDDPKKKKQEEQDIPMRRIAT